MQRLARTTEKLFTRALIKHKENTALKEIIERRQRKATGKRAILKGQHCVTRASIYAPIVKLDRANKDAKKKAKSHKKNYSSEPQSTVTTTPSPDCLIDPSLTLMVEIDSNDSGMSDV